VRPDVSVVVPTFNRRHQLERTLVGLAAQTGVDLDHEVEVIVVSDGSTDGTDDWLRSSATPLPVSPCFQSNAGPAAARNRGVAAAHGPLVLFLDDDVVPAPDLVRTHIGHHHTLDDDLVVVGPMRTPDDLVLSPWVQWEQNMLYKQYDAMLRGDWQATARQFYTANASLARRHFEAAGGFDPKFRRAEDVELAYRLADAGLTFTFVPDAVVLHYAERSFESWLANASAYGRNDVIFGRDQGQGWLLDAIGHEFHERHALVRELTRLSLRHRRLGRAAVAATTWAAKVVSRTGPERAANVSLSALYNLEYYRGMADEFGDPRELLARFDEPPAKR
jgi:GT2 family glycosyltransferase